MGGLLQTRREPMGLALGALKLLEYACARGADRGALIGRMRLGKHALHDPDARLPTRCYYNLIAAAADVLDDPWFGIHYLETAQPSDIGAVGFAAASSATLGQALARVARYLGYLTESQHLNIFVESGEARVEWNFTDPPHPALALASEMYGFDFIVLAARLVGSPISARTLYFRHAALQPVSSYETLFGCTPQFEAGRDGCTFDADVLERPMPQANEALAAFFDRWLESRVGPGGQDLNARVRREILRCLSDGVPGLPVLASRLATSSRTLQRQLAAENTTLRRLVEETRRTVGLEQVAANVPLAEVCWLLGFQDSRSFFRAFRRWTGMSPAAWRRERTGGM
jgi:AraC-like DNA-binding protein